MLSVVFDAVKFTNGVVVFPVDSGEGMQETKTSCKHSSLIWTNMSKRWTLEVSVKLGSVVEVVLM